MVDTDNTPRHSHDMPVPTDPTFHPTVWPAEPPQLPAIPRYRLAADPKTGGLRVLQPRLEDVDDWPAPVDLPPDWVLRELPALDVRSAEAVIDLAATWGLPCPGGVESFAYFGTEPPTNVVADLERWAAAGRPGLVHPLAVEVHLRTLRTLQRHLEAHVRGGDEDALMAAWEPEGPGEHLPHSGAQAWQWWDALVNRALSVFAVHVETLPGSAVLTRPLPNLYTAGCLQLVRYLAAGSGDVLHECANTRCGRLFSRQRDGGARYGYRSRGVRYCSPLCAKAQSERERRQRRAKDQS